MQQSVDGCRRSGPSTHNPVAVHPNGQSKRMRSCAPFAWRRARRYLKGMLSAISWKTKPDVAFIGAVFVLGAAVVCTSIALCGIDHPVALIPLVIITAVSERLFVRL